MNRVKRLLVPLLVVMFVANSIGMAFAQEYPQPGSAVTNAVVQNKATGAGQNATVQVMYYDQNGVADPDTQSFNIAPKAVVEVKTQDAPVGDGFVGAAVLSSNQPIAAVVSVQNRGVPGDVTDPNRQTQAAYNGTSEPATILYFPSVWRFSGIVSRLTVQNAEAQPADIKLTFKKRDGSAAGELTTTLAANGQRTFYLGNAADVPAAFPANFIDGSVVVESTNGRKLAGASTATWPNRAGAYQALGESNKGKILYAPSHYRFILPADDQTNWQNRPGVEWILFSALNLQNTSASASANVTATYTARGAATASLVKTFQIPPLSAIGLNTQNGGSFPAADFAPLSKAGGGAADWDGSVLIESDQDLVGTNVTNWGKQGFADLYALTGPAEGSNILYLPAQYRLEYTATSGWSQWSAINLQNIGETSINASDLVIQYISQDGTTVATFSGADLNLPSGLAAGAAIGLNTRNGGDLDASAFAAFPTDNGRRSFIGGIYVQAPAGSKLIAVGNIVYANRASVYNAIP